jgi:hypothetical protein
VYYYYYYYYYYYWNRDSAVGVATGYGLDDREVGVRVPLEVNNFYFSMSSRPALGYYIVCFIFRADSVIGHRLLSSARK